MSAFLCDFAFVCVRVLRLKDVSLHSIVCVESVCKFYFLFFYDSFSTLLLSKLHGCGLLQVLCTKIFVVDE